jgi:hypothetical protein
MFEVRFSKLNPREFPVMFSNTADLAEQLVIRLGFQPDPWQLDVLTTRYPRLLLNCSRQAGKSTVVALVSLIEAMYYPQSLVLLLSRSLRQSTELYRRVAEFHRRLGEPIRKKRKNHELLLKNGSRLVSLPCSGDTIRGFANVHLLVIDEAARVPDDLYRSVRPMLAVSHGRLICLSTPHGKRGFFYDAWARGGDDWKRIEIPAQAIPRISVDFLAEERRNMSEAWFRQEYECSFEALEGLVFPDFARCVVAVADEATGVARPESLKGVRNDPNPTGRKVGGIDFGFRNPFAAVWGVLDRDGILWLTGEHYCRQRPLSYHVQHLPRRYRWYADPAGASEISELRCAGLAISAGNNSLRLGIEAVASRLQNGTLRILPGRCPNLLAEAGLYRYSTEETDRRSETPVDDHNHALAALRYLVSKLDSHRMARVAKSTPTEETPSTQTAPVPVKPRKWLSVYNDFLWND